MTNSKAKDDDDDKKMTTTSMDIIDLTTEETASIEILDLTTDYPPSPKRRRLLDSESESESESESSDETYETADTLRDAIDTLKWPFLGVRGVLWDMIPFREKVLLSNATPCVYQW